MSDAKLTTQSGEKEDRRWSEPVRLGEILAALCVDIAARSAAAAPQGRIQTSVNTLLRKAG